MKHGVCKGGERTICNPRPLACSGPSGRRPRPARGRLRSLGRSGGGDDGGGVGGVADVGGAGGDGHGDGEGH
eukprot:7308436-Lingulodinium_polyedra.AAC.1